jgi:hypothetical protein
LKKNIPKQVTEFEEKHPKQVGEFGEKHPKTSSGV